MTIEQMIARQQELLNAARSAGRNMTREEAAEFDSLQRSIDAARAAGAGIAHGGQSSTPAAPSNNTPEGQRQQTPAAGEGGNGGQDPQNTQRAIEAERQRIRSIEDLCTEFGLDARSYIDNGSTEEQVRAAVLEHLRSQHSPVATGIQVTDTQEDKFRRAAADSLLMRSGMTLERPEDGARSLMGMSIRDLAIECLQRDGSSESNLNRRSSDELYTMMARGFYNPEASFPAILDQTIEKAYKEGYRKVAVTFDKFTKKGSLKDFKKHDNYYVAGPVGEFYEVPENGELKHDIFKDDKLPQRQLKTYGRQFTLSRKAFIDDDIGLVTSLPARYAAAARKTINKQVYQILINNSNIYDGAALFGKEHKNLLASGTGVTQEAMQTMIMALANQKDQFGESIIINPATVISRALNKVAVTARVDLANKAQATYTVKSGGFKKDMTIRKASAGRLEAVIHSQGKPLSITKFHTTAPKKTGAKANIIKGSGLKQLIYGNIKAFKGPNGQIYQRRSTARLPIKKLSSNSIPKMIGNEEKVYGVVKPSIDRNLQHYVEQQIELLTK